MLKTMQKHGVTLAVFAAVLTGLTALVNALTKTTIEEQARSSKRRCSIR
jgi:electron transport complex protein RnfG